MSKRSRRVVDHPANNAKKSQAVALLALGTSASEVARQLGVDRGTIARWRQDPAVAEELQALQDEIRDQVHDKLVALTMEMVEFLHEVGQDTRPPKEGGAGGMARVKAVQVWCELLGIHKGNPARHVERSHEVESEEELRALIRSVPRRMLEQVLAELDQEAAG